MKRKTNFLFVLLLASFVVKANIAEIFFHETFEGLNLPAGWSTDDASGQGVVWQQCNNPLNCPPYSQQLLSCSELLFKSPGFYDGYMFVDSYSAGILPQASKPYLQTPIIDCSQKDQVFIRFYTYIFSSSSYYPEDYALLRVRADNQAWQEFKIFPNLNLDDVNSLQGHNGQLIQLDISSVAANKANVQVEWRWTTRNDVAWMIDEVELLDGDPLMDKVIWHDGTFDFGPNGWAVLPNIQFDSCHWVKVNSAMVNLAKTDSKAEALACWTGVNDGAMLINASYCYVFGNPSLYTRTDLLSPRIDLSNVPSGTKLYLRFNQLLDVANIAQAGLPRTSIAISLDNGQTFMPPIDVNPLAKFFQLECGEVNIPLPSSVAGKPNVRIKFIFSGDTHFWMVDEVRIAYPYDVDIEVNPQFFNVAPDYSVPSSQVRPIGLFSQIRNAGLITNQSVVAHVAVFNSQYEMIFEDEKAMSLLQPSYDWTNVEFPNHWLPNDTPDEYLIFYWVTTSEDDENNTNDRLYWRYSVTEDVFSKSEFCVSTTDYFRPVDNITYEIGNCYYMINGSKLKAEAVSFAFRNAEKFDNKNAILSINLYRWRKGNNSGDVNHDSIANLNEFESIAQNIYEIVGNENGHIITVPISFQPEVETILEDNTYYFVTIGYLDPVVHDFEEVPFHIAASEDINYTATFINSYSDGKPAFISMLREGDQTGFRANAWALRRIPFVDLHVSSYTNSVDDQTDELLDFNITPNPANNFVWVTAEFTDGREPISIEIFDLCGKKVFGRNFDTEFVIQQPISVGDLSNGTYTVRVISGEKMRTKKLLVLR